LTEHDFGTEQPIKGSPMTLSNALASNKMIHQLTLLYHRGKSLLHADDMHDYVDTVFLDILNQLAKSMAQTQES
jgi:hypothetical protein